MNAVTMGVVTCILRYFSEEEISAYDAMSRLRINDSVIFPLPKPVENYFQQRMRYHHNVSTRATDGPSIVQIEKPHLAVAPYRLYAENVLHALPTKYKPLDPKEVEVGTVRAYLPINALMRILERYLMPKVQKDEDQDDDEFEFFWYQASDDYSDFVLDDKAPYVIPNESSKKRKYEDDGSNILAPSILAREAGHILRKERITTSDFLLPTNLLSSSNDKIYGFYYVT